MTDANTQQLDEGFLVKLIRKLAPDIGKVSDWVEKERENNPELDVDELAEYLSDYIVWTYAKQGAALALPGAIPGLGTIIQIGTEIGATSADIALMVRNQTYLVFALGCCYGIKGRETLIQDTLICMGLWTKAIVLTKQGFIKIGSKVAEAQFKKRFPGKIFQAINKKVGKTILTKYGTKRGGVAVGRLIPFGVGALIGGGFNYLVMKTFKNKSLEYLRLNIVKRKRKQKSTVKRKTRKKKVVSKEV